MPQKIHYSSPTKFRFWAALICLATAQQAAANSPQLRLNIEVSEDSQQRPRIINGEMIFRPSDAAEEYCFWLPYNDPEVARDWAVAKRFDLTRDRFTTVRASGGSTEIKNPRDLSIISSMSERLLKIKSPGAGKTIRIQFVSAIPIIPNFTETEWLVDGYYPQPLTRCPGADDDEDLPGTLNGMDIVWNGKIPTGWKTAVPGEQISTTLYRLTGRKFSFFLYKAARVTTLAFGDILGEVHYQSESFSSLLGTIDNSINHINQLLGEFPYHRLVFVETRDLQPTDIPGLVLFNSPPQDLVRSIQGGLLNWDHWIMASMIASQWYGASIGVDNPDDEWLLLGFVGFIVDEILSANPKIYDLFAADSKHYTGLHFDYLQMEEITAAMLSRQPTQAPLTDSDYKSLHDSKQQNRLSFIRHTIALRAMRAAGSTGFASFFKRFSQTSTNKNISPSKFFQSVDYMPSPFSPPERLRAKVILNAWWATTGWTDWKLDQFTTVKVGDQWNSTVAIQQVGDINLPTSVEIVGSNSEVMKSEVKESDTGAITFEFRGNFKASEAFIDKDRHFFDIDRFNNRSRILPIINFFPGNASTLKDDEYTLLWCPYPFRRPGEDFAFGVISSLYRYMQTNTILRTEYMPARQQFGLDLRADHNFTNTNNRLGLSLSQSFIGSRIAEVSLARNPVFNTIPLGGVVKSRFRQTVGDPASRHLTGAIGMSSGIGGRRTTCALEFGGQFEKVLKVVKADFDYSRTIAEADGTCNILSGTDLLSRFFYGQLDATVDHPAVVRFNPEDLNEARIRVDVPELPTVTQIRSLSNDLAFPLILPMSEGVVLTRQMKGRLFYDFGHAIDTDVWYRAAGVGITAPIGGNVTGIGSLSITRLSLLAVLYSNVDGDISRKPRLLFDLAGNL